MLKKKNLLVIISLQETGGLCSGSAHGGRDFRNVNEGLGKCPYSVVSMFHGRHTLLLIFAASSDQT